MMSYRANAFKRIETIGVRIYDIRVESGIIEMKVDGLSFGG